MKKRAVKPNTVTYLGLIENLRYGTRADFDKHVSKLIESMMEGESLSAEVMNAYLQAYSTHHTANLYEEYLRVFGDAIKEKRILPDMMTFTILINNQIAVRRNEQVTEIQQDVSNAPGMRQNVVGVNRQEELDAMWRRCFSWFTIATAKESPDDQLLSAIFSASAYASQHQAIEFLRAALEKEFRMTYDTINKEWRLASKARPISSRVLAAILQVLYRCGEVPLALFCWNVTRNPDVKNAEKLIKLCRRYKRSDLIPLIEQQATQLSMASVNGRSNR